MRKGSGAPSGEAADREATTIVDALGRHAANQPDATVVLELERGETPGRSLTFGALWTQARRVGAALRAAAPRGRRVLILQEPGVDFVLSLFGCFCAGMAATPAPLPAFRVNSRSAQRFAHLVSDAAPDLILTHSDHLDKLQWFAHQHAGLAAQRWVCSDASGEPDRRGASVYSDGPPAPRPSDIALIQYTSGSTADAKGVVIRHRSLSANLTAIENKFALTQASRVLN